MRQILIIDDNPTQLQARAMVLRSAGFAVSTASTGEAALELLAKAQDDQQFGLVVTDHVMPGGSGAEFVRALRRNDPNLPVIVISGLAQAEDEYSGMEVTFLQKPCPPPVLVDQVRQRLQRV